MLRKAILLTNKRDFKLNPIKCIFGARFGKLLGFIVSQHKIEIEQIKIKAVTTQKIEKEVKDFLGCIYYIFLYRKADNKL